MELPVIAILAGGLATRLRPTTTHIPKSMLPVAGQPFIARQLELLRAQGGRRVVLCLGHLGEQVRDYVGDGAAFGLEVAYSWDGEKLLGTGGALKRAESLLSDDFLIMYGDSYLTVDFKAVYRCFLQQHKSGLMTVYCNRNQWDKSNVVFEKGEIIRYDKVNRDPAMRYIDYGLGVLRKSVIAAVPDDTVVDLASLYQSCLAGQDLAGFEATERFYEIGSPAGLAETEQYLKSKI